MHIMTSHNHVDILIPIKSKLQKILLVKTKLRLEPGVFNAKTACHKHKLKQVTLTVQDR